MTAYLMKSVRGLWMISAFATLVVLMVGCQESVVKLSDGRQITLADMDREVAAAHDQLYKTSARITAREWEYRDETLFCDQPVYEEMGMGPVMAAHTRSLNAYKETENRYVFDAMKHRQVTYTKDLRDLPALARMLGLSPSDVSLTQSSSVMLYQWTEKEELLSAAVIEEKDPANIFLKRCDTRVPPNFGGTWAKLPFVPTTSMLCESDFLVDARKAGAAIEVVHEDGLELVKVSWNSSGYAETGWFRPDMSFRMHRIEVRKVQGGDKLAWKTEATDYRMINGVCYPFKYETIRFDSPDHRQLSFHRRIEIKQAEFGCQFADEEFQITLPVGTKVYYSHGPADAKYVKRTVTGGAVLAVTLTNAPPDEPVKVDIGELFSIAKSSSKVQ